MVSLYRDIGESLQSTADGSALYKKMTDALQQRIGQNNDNLQLKVFAAESLGRAQRIHNRISGYASIDQIATVDRRIPSLAGTLFLGLLAGGLAFGVVLPLFWIGVVEPLRKIRSEALRSEAFQGAQKA